MNKYKFFAMPVVALLLTLGMFSSAKAEIMYGVTHASPAGNQPGIALVRFDSATPGTLTTIGNFGTGLVAGHTIRTIDFRPANGILYAISANATNTTGQLYTVSLTTAQVFPIGPGFSLGTNTDPNISMDFNPVVDRIRIVIGSDTGLGQNNNFRLNPNDGLLVTANDTNLAFAPAPEPNNGLSAQIVAIAYTNNTPGATQTTLYAWEWLNDFWVTIGNVNGTPNSPNTGLLFTVFDPGGFIAESSGIGMDISGASATCYVARNLSGQTGNFRLRTKNVTTGAETDIGQFPANSFVNDISVQPVVTASGVTLSGRVALGPEGRGITNVIVSVTDSNGVVRSTTTGKGGRYSFSDLETGGSYIVTVRSRNYSFSPRVIQLFDSLADIDFFAGQ